MLKEVGLNTYPLPPGFRQPLRFVENEQAMHTWITRACGLGTQPEISHLRSMLHISGQGTIVNLGAYPQGEPALGPVNRMSMPVSPPTWPKSAGAGAL